ncbi:SDR family oxidoreductase [Chitinophaga pinensis]|uniref:Short-chain dehydrogenase/reductase SDR n=1 Tax=Chitinophaga pinensis (strain ATCC 43595 / DSM 2588 / LMG 13176 / NBRC 15968 / NCIMB 11800 / UQM 2034) TaxID=485918 RepID=A0A979G3Q0_CHIPD|nr:SDR family oxidoreductase [Chitinophaga pinensis]ACU60136.1 short-chain dehydrogenase/reductase SDR [Chitinophaga pinensis DSM 2588]
MKTIFITGASSGLGKATARLFSARGWRVIASMRNPEKETDLLQLDNVILISLDVTDPVQIEKTVGKITQQYELDVVFNNAGYGLIAPLEAVSDQQITRQFETNVMGVIRITKAFIPYFREKGRGLFITTTSMGGVFGPPLSSVYCASKFAMEGWTAALSYELGQLGIGIKTVAPGGIKTDFTGRSLDTAAHPAYEKMMGQLYAGFDPTAFTTAEQIAEVVYEAATDGKEQLRYLAGEDAKTLYARSLAIGNDAFHKERTTLFFGE